MLGVGRRAGEAEIRKAYLEAARRHHPDVHAGDGEVGRREADEQMRRLNEAWAVLRDPAARAHYDDALAAGRRPAGASDLPPGKSWTPRTGDDRWMTDFQGWAAETDSDIDEDDTPYDPRPAPRSRGPLALLPVALFAVSVVCVVLATAFGSRGLLAAGLVSLAASSILFVMLPIFEMTRGRRR